MSDEEELAPHVAQSLRCAHEHIRMGREHLFGSSSAQDVEEGPGCDASKAILHFNKALFLKPNDADVYVMRAQAYEKLLDIRSAIANLKHALKLDDSAGVRFKLAELLDVQGKMWLDLGNGATAACCFNEALKLEPLRPTFWLHRCVANVRAGDLTRALHDITKALAFDQGTADMFILRSKLRWALGMKEAGNADMQVANELNPDHPEVRAYEQRMWDEAEKVYYSASACLLQGDFHEAIRLLSSALQLSPGDVKLLLLRAAALREKGDLKQSMKDIDHASESYFRSMHIPTHTDAHGALAAIDKGMGSGGSSGGGEDNNEDNNDFSTLRRHLQQHDVREHPEIARQRNLCLNAMAVEMIRQERFADALTVFNRVIAAETASAQQDGSTGEVVDGRFYVNRGDCWRALGKMQQALADYHHAYDLDPANWQVTTRLSVVHHAFGTQLFNSAEYSQAEVEFTIAIRYNPKVALYFLHRGNSAFYQQKFDSAHKDFVAALEIDPHNAEIRTRIAQFEPNLESVQRVLARSGAPAPTVSGPPRLQPDRGAQGGAVMEEEPQTHRISNLAELRKRQNPPRISGTALPQISQQERTIHKNARQANVKAKVERRKVRTLFEARPTITKDQALWTLLEPAKKSWGR